MGPKSLVTDQNLVKIGKMAMIMDNGSVEKGGSGSRRAVGV